MARPAWPHHRRRCRARARGAAALLDTAGAQPCDQGIAQADQNSSKQQERSLIMSVQPPARLSATGPDAWEEELIAMWDDCADIAHRQGLRAAVVAAKRAKYAVRTFIE